MQDESNHRSDDFMVYWAHRGPLPSFLIINDGVAHKIHCEKVPSEWHFRRDWTEASAVAFTGEGGSHPTVRCGAADQSSFLQGEPVKLT